MEIKNEVKRAQLLLGQKAVSLLQLSAMQRSRLPLCATTRLSATHDVPQLIATLLYSSPWKCRYNGRE